MWEQNPASGQGIPLREYLPVFFRSVQGIKDVLGERDGDSTGTTGNVIHSFQLTDLGLCWFKPVGGDRKACLSEKPFRLNVSKTLQEVHMAYVKLSLAQQVALGKSAFVDQFPSYVRPDC